MYVRMYVHAYICEVVIRTSCYKMLEVCEDFLCWSGWSIKMEFILRHTHTHTCTRTRTRTHTHTHTHTGTFSATHPTWWWSLTTPCCSWTARHWSCWTGKICEVSRSGRQGSGWPHQWSLCCVGVLCRVWRLTLTQVTVSCHLSVADSYELLQAVTVMCTMYIYYICSIYITYVVYILHM